ncbi:prepilin peptidase [Cellulomonas edaphi]|uniref:Prepilin leader peptidase/N-methyltransferase n=1 Tax=Cellulomonas edaphi TaxID=3053468 RepID=A0ABT7S6H6_9CELL|nr:A24 family peptidase [Cellulomons edaphi]MDM7831224.1 prepilin peptidase [Cellulomons edaphi]
MTGLAVTLAVVLGLAVGSFLNVVVWRVPRGESVSHPPSACPRCGHAIRARDNVPVVSWLLLHGRCRDCGEPISARYPTVEAGTAVVFGLVAWWTGLSWTLPALLYLAAISIALALIDIETHRLPDRIVLPSYPIAVALLVLASANPAGEPDWSALVRMAIGGVLMFVVYFLMLLAYPRGMGFGDVKLAGVLGLYLGWFGWGALVVGWFSAFLLGGLYSVVLLARRKAGRKSGIPFGPWMILGAAVGIGAGNEIWSAYLGSM